MRSVTAMACGSIEAGSVKTYTPGVHKFRVFVRDTCAKLCVPVWPHETTSELRDLINGEGVIEAFVVYAHEDGLRDVTIGVYISALKHFATDAYGRHGIPGMRTVKLLLKGCQKAQGPPRDGKLDLGIIRLRRLLDLLNQQGAASYESCLWRAMFCCAFFAASRVSEYLMTADGIKLLTREKVSRLENGGIRFMLLKTKNNPSGRPQEVDFPRLADEPACPATALGDFLTIRQTSAPNTPFFSDRGGKPIVPGQFNDELKRLMAIIEPELKGRFTSKSFRIGATSDAFAIGVDPLDIGNLGRWALGSTAYMSYVVSLARAKRAVGVQRLISQVGRSADDGPSNLSFN